MVKTDEVLPTHDQAPTNHQGWATTICRCMSVLWTAAMKIGRFLAIVWLASALGIAWASWTDRHAQTTFDWIALGLLEFFALLAAFSNWVMA